MNIDTRNVTTNIADVDSLAGLAEQAIASGDEGRAIPIVRAGAEHHRSALLWQWTGLLQRSLDDHEAALESFVEASRLAPGDVKIAQGRAPGAEGTWWAIVGHACSSGATTPLVSRMLP